MVCDGQDHVEIVEEGGVTSDVCHHSVDIDRVARQCDHQKDGGHNYDVDVEEVIEFGHTVYVANYCKSCEKCQGYLDSEEVDLVSVIADQVSNL